MSHPFDSAGSVAPEALAGTVLELHWAAQFLASAGQTFAEPAEDDSHRAMRWDAELRSFVSAPFSGAYPFRLALRPLDLSVQLVDRTGEAMGTLQLAGQTREEVYEWLTLGMATYMGGAPPLIERPEYEMPAHPIETGARFSADQDAELSELSSLYAGAAALLEEFIDGRNDASPILCWPHHFDIATLLTLEAGPDAESSKTVGVGFAPSGGGYSNWYWYVTPWPYPEPSALPALAGAGAWHTEGWTGAVLTADEVVAGDVSGRTAMVKGFLKEAAGAASSLLVG